MFTSPINFVPWLKNHDSPKILDARLTGYNILTEWDVALWVDGGKPAEGYAAIPVVNGLAPVSVVSRWWLDMALRGMGDLPNIFRRRGRPFRHPLTTVRDFRNCVGSGRLTIAHAAKHYSIPIRTAQEILAGRAYWWCGGGSPTWEGFR